VYLSAYRDPAASQVVVVAINTTTSSQSLPLSIDAGAFGTLTPYETSATNNIAPLATIAGGSSVTATLSAQSVTTFVGSAN
jgi:glucuronoarabinoxylan endo-1,4-beta-xylanase